jgi:hypothetical protein
LRYLTLDWVVIFEVLRALGETVHQVGHTSTDSKSRAENACPLLADIIICEEAPTKYAERRSPCRVKDGTVHDVDHNREKERFRNQNWGTSITGALFFAGQKGINYPEYTLRFQVESRLDISGSFYITPVLSYIAFSLLEVIVYQS